MSFGRFIDNGKKYEITTPITPSTWSNFLFNDEYHTEVSQTLQGKSSVIISNYNQEAFTTGYRYFYVLNHETKKAFNPNYIPLRRPVENYSCVHGLGKTTLSSECDGIKSELEIVVPVKGYGENWKVRLTNTADQKQSISLFSAIGLADGGTMGGECVYNEEKDVLYRYAHPYHVYYEDKEKVESIPSYYYLFSDRTPDSYDMSRRRFWGCDDIGEYPAALKNETCSNLIAEAEEFCGCLQHRFELQPQESVELNLRVGVAESVDEIAELKQSFTPDYVKKCEDEVQAYWEKTCAQFAIDTPDKNLDYFVNYWLKKQIILLTRQNRGGVYCPVRNQLQDAMGYSLVDPQGAKKYVYDVLKLQKPNGFITQWYMTDGSPKRALCLLKHTDGPLWLILAVIIMICQNGDKKMFKEQIAYEDGTQGPVYEHLIKAADYMYGARGSHGLCLMGDGDWTDPVNGVGRKGKGESTWSTLALIYGIELILEQMNNYLDAETRERLAKNRAELIGLVNEHCWSKDRYVAGFDDDGVAFGSVEDNDRLFLNAQTWAILAGVPDEERLAILVNTLKRLETPFGPLLIDPLFDKWDARWGRISVKKSGTTENGSVYNHASMFKAFSDAVRGDGDAAYETLYRTLPTNPDNPPEKNGQLPIYLSNYYYAKKGSPNFGHSSGNYGTGTISWMLLVALEKLLGVRATVDGLQVTPCLPSGWEEATCTRKFRDALYHVTIRKGAPKCLVNGAEYTGDALPYEAGQTYQVEITC